MTGKSDQVKGKAEQVTGIVTGDKDLEAEGNADRLTGETAEKIDHAQGKVHRRGFRHGQGSRGPGSRQGEGTDQSARSRVEQV